MPSLGVAGVAVVGTCALCVHVPVHCWWAPVQVIVGSVDGNRLWGKELKTRLAFVEWSPDGRSLLFVTLDGEVHVYNQYGNRLGSVGLFAAEESSTAPVRAAPGGIVYRVGG